MSDEQELPPEEKLPPKEEVAEKDEAEEVPDYEITEDTGEKDDEGDKRLGKSREERDHKQLSNREKRQLRKKRLAEKFDAKDQVIKQQQEQLNNMSARINEIDGKLSQVDQGALVQTYQEAVTAFQDAERKHSEAFKDGDGTKATAAMREMYSAQKRIDDCEAIHARNQSQPAKQPQVQPKDPVLVAKAVSWAERNPWFKQGGEDDDSAIADTIAAKLVKEGFNPKTDGYWDELDDRLADRGIGDDEEQQEQTQSEQIKQTSERPTRRSPPVGGGNGRGDLGSGKTQVKLPTVFINALKEAGIWDDPVRRNKAIRDHQRIRAEGAR